MHRDVLICLCIVTATLAVYWQVSRHEFINFDDTQYITENRHVQAGLNAESITWAFTSTRASNWHPLTWLSHMLDYQLFGLDPGRHHLTNVFFHIANTLLLFLILNKMTGESWRSGFVAALFALHPLHVESVAWAAERKDVLSTFFWMLTMWSYVRYVERSTVSRYLPVILFFAFGLMAKPMLVTLPFVLLLLDYWPLGRIQLGEAGKPWQSSFDFRLVWEKIPLFALAAASCVATFLAQQKGGAMAPLQHYSIDARISNALVAYIAYIWKMIWPFQLAILYPHPSHIPLWQAGSACLVIVMIFVLAVRSIKRRPYFTVGWLWYVGTLVPVIGLIQVGEQAMADRYTYVPLIGIFIVIAWGVPELARRWRGSRIGLGTAATALLAFLTVATWFQIRYWTDSITLFEHTLDVTDDNYVAHYSLGIALASRGKFTDAIRHYEDALHIAPNSAQTHNNLGAALAEQKKFSDAIHHYSEALRIAPSYFDAHYNLGLALVSQRRFDDAVHHYSEALRIEPYDVDAHNNLGNLLGKLGRTREAYGHFRKALQMDPDNSTLHYNFGNIYKIDKKLDEAIQQYQEALAIQPDYTAAMNNLARAHGAKAEYDRAISLYMKIIDLEPESYVAYYNIACIYSEQNRAEESITWLKKAKEKGFKDWELLESDEDLENIRGSSYYKEFISGLGIR